jgi:hypothetical protein
MNVPPAVSIVEHIRQNVLDSELAALLWILAGSRVPVHVTAPGGDALEVAEALRAVASDPAAVTSGPGSRLEDVLRQPVPIRPASGAVLVLGDSRVVAAHFLRPPLRDGAGHIRPQGPAVLATWDVTTEAWEHFAWGVIPELADAAGLRPGDFEIEQERRREFLEALVASPITDAGELARALRGYGVRTAPA